MDNFSASFKKLFWDVDLSSLDENKNKDFVIERVLEFGNLEDFAELKKHYALDDIVSVLKNSSNLSYKTGNFYALILGVPRKEVLCLRKPSTRRQDRF